VEGGALTQELIIGLLIICAGCGLMLGSVVGILIRSLAMPFLGLGAGVAAFTIIVLSRELTR
jgi:hypothetical protein